MSFWIIILAMATLAVMVLYFYTEKPSTSAIAGSGHDRVFYKARLAEIEQDLKVGRLDAEAMEAATAEEARKLIRLESDLPEPTVGLNSKTRSAILCCSLLFVPLFSFGFYVSVGAYFPQTLRAAQETASDPSIQSIADVLEIAEARLAANPSDVKGWVLIAPIYLRLGRADDAVTAYRNALQYSDREPDLLSALGEALVVQASGTVTKEALTMFDEVLGIKPEHIQAGYYSGLASEQNGDIEKAVTTWQLIVDHASGDEPWLPNLKSKISKLSGAALLSRTPELSEDAVSQAQEMNAADRNEMINQMVASLAGRLDDDPNDIIGWERLIRSYLVLGRKDEARSAIVKARSHFSDNITFIQKLEKIEADLK